MCLRRTCSPEWHLICTSACATGPTYWYATTCLLQMSERWETGRGDKANPALQAVASNNCKHSTRPPWLMVHQRHTSLFFSLSTRNFLPPRSRPHQCSGYVRFTRDCELSKKMQMSKSTLSNLLFHPPTVRRKLPSGSVVSLERGIQLLTQCKLFCFGRSFLS